MSSHIRVIENLDTNYFHYLIKNLCFNWSTFFKKVKMTKT